MLFVIRMHSEDVPVLDLAVAKKMQLPFVIGVGDNYFSEVKDILSSTHFYNSIEDYCRERLSMSKTDYNRAYCAYFHINRMDSYFEKADTDDAMNFFWGEGVCRRLFMKLNHENILELACGRGRHVPEYIKYAKKITLVDILEKNIQICRERFKQYNKIYYYCNNGKDLKGLPSDAYTSLFTYDAMVHFELMDIASYLQECYRVLRKGGIALFHHSNNCSDYKVDFSTGIHGRNYMSKDLFAHLSYRAGLEIVEQKIMDWGNVKELDCLTLVRKPE